MKRLLIGLLALQGCAMTYEVPTTKQENYQTQHNADMATIVAKTKKLLTVQGYQITNSDDNTGIISTGLKNYRMTPAIADCGKTMGIDYLKDNRTKTELAINVLIDENYVQITTNIQGEYKPGGVTQDITLTCVSRGVIEKGLLKEITG